MKRLLLLPLCFLAMSTIVSSCELDEDLLGEAIAENEENQDPPVDPPGEHEGSLDINTTPCDYNLDGLSANGTMAIDCQLDLQGQTKTLPSNVTLEFSGGEIINGTLSFNGGNIDGNLLHKDLNVTGNVQLIDPSFQFHPERWDFVQGQTTSAIAQSNTDNLENLLFETKDFGATSFVIDVFDAFFEISKVTSTTTNQNWYPSLEAVNIPADFHFSMSDNTVLRVFPNDRNNGGAILAAREVSNTIISGGNLVGDRDEHDYSKSNPGEGGNHLLFIHAADNITVDGVTMSMGSAGALVMNALRFAFQPDYLPVHDVVIKNCVFDKNRRMATAITDGHDILLENNTYIDTALDRPNSDGGVVGYAINIEPVRKRDENGVLIYYEKAYDITIRNNTERGSRNGGFNIFSGQNITFENNVMENSMAWSFASGCKFRNNTFIPSENSKNKPAISVGGSGDTVFDNEISGNTVTGYSIGISAYHGKMKIFDNILNENGAGIQIKKATDMQIYNNDITSAESSSKGVSLQLTYGDNIDIYNNNVDVAGSHLYFVELNRQAGEENNLVSIHDNSFDSDAATVISRSNGVLFNNNVSEGSLSLLEASNVDVISNTIVSDDFHGVYITGAADDLIVHQNTISYPPDTRFECISISSGTNQNEVSLLGNVCN